MSQKIKFLLNKHEGLEQLMGMAKIVLLVSSIKPKGIPKMVRKWIDQHILCYIASMMIWWGNWQLSHY